MAGFPFLPIVLLSLLFSTAVGSGSHQHHRPNPTATTHYDFIKSSCGVTRYPDLCYYTLSPYAATVRSNSTQLVNAAIQVSLNDAVTACNAVQNLSETLKQPKEAGAVKDCVENMKDSVDELKDSMAAMKRGMDGPDFAMEVGNLQTWVSAALTDEDTCMDGIEEAELVNGKVKDAIRGRIVRVAQLTSNALALINHLC